MGDINDFFKERYDKILQELYKRSLKYYLILTFLLTYGAGLAIYLLGGLGENLLLSVSIMLIPAVVTIIVIITTEKWSRFSNFTKALGLRLGKKRYIFIYPFLMFITIVFIYFMTYLIFPDVFIPMSKLPEVMAEFQIELGATSVFMQIIIIFFLNSVVGS